MEALQAGLEKSPPNK